MNVQDTIFDLLGTNNDNNILSLLNNQQLLDAKTNDGNSIILRAIYYGKKDLAKEIQKHVQIIDIHEAAALGDFLVIENILKKDEKVINSWSNDGFSPLQLACAFSDSISIIRLLLDKGADINAISKNEKTIIGPIHAAVFGGNKEIVKCLIDYGVDINARQEGGFTPLHEAASRDDIELLKILLDNGADKNAKTNDGKTPYTIAYEKNHKKFLEMLKT